MEKNVDWVDSLISSVEAAVAANAAAQQLAHWYVYAYSKYRGREREKERDSAKEKDLSWLTYIRCTNIFLLFMSS